MTLRATSVFVLTLCALCVFASSVPPYAAPGTWSQFEGVLDTFTNTTVIFGGINAGSTGQNYSGPVSDLKLNYSFGSQAMFRDKRIIALSLQRQLNNYSIPVPHEIHFFRYASNAPLKHISACSLPTHVQFVEAIAYVGDSKIAFDTNTGYVFDFPSSDTTSVEDKPADCLIRSSFPIPGYSDQSIETSSQYANTVSLIAGGTVMVLDVHTWKFTVYSLPTAGASGWWYWLAQHPVTGEYYMTSTDSNYDETIWAGKLPKNSSNSGSGGSPIQLDWSQVKAWKGRDPGQFSVDIRQEKVYGEPLWCSTDSLSDQYCWGAFTMKQYYSGPSLNGITPWGGGALANLYDPNCN